MHKPHAPSCERNREPILAVLQAHFADRRHVLEIGSGTGQHAVYFAAALPQLIWQTSERKENLAGIRAWLDEANLPNTPAPIELDVSGEWPQHRFDALFTANTLHIMSWQDVQLMFKKIQQAVSEQALFVAYGPFNQSGHYTSDSNAQFDVWLKQRDAHMGIRDAEAVDQLAEQAGFYLRDDIAMPANNRCRIWQRAPRKSGLVQHA